MKEIKIKKVEKKPSERTYYIERIWGISKLRFYYDLCWRVDISHFEFFDRDLCLFCENVLRGLNSNGKNNK